MHNNKNLQVFALFILLSILLASCRAPTATPGIVGGGITPLGLTVQLTPDPTHYGTCEGRVSTMQVTLTGSPSEIARVDSLQGELYWTNPDGTTAPGIVSGFLPPLTRQVDGTYSATFDWSDGLGFAAPLLLNFDAIAFDSAGAVLFKSEQVSVNFNPCPGLTSSSPSIHFPTGLVPPSVNLTVNASLSPDPVFYQAGCDPHVSNARVTLSGTLAPLVASFDSGLSWTLPDGTAPAGANGVPLALSRQPDGSYTGSYDWGIHPPGLTGPYVLNFVVVPVDSTGIALDKQVATVQFLPCPAPVLPTLPPFHVIKFEFDCLSPTSSLIIFTLDQTPTGTFQGMIGNQVWPCTTDTKNNMRLICTGPGVQPDVKVQVSLNDILNKQVVFSQNTTDPVCPTPTVAPTCKLTIPECNKLGFKLLDTVKCVCY